MGRKKKSVILAEKAEAERLAREKDEKAKSEMPEAELEKEKIEIIDLAVEKREKLPDKTIEGRPLSELENIVFYSEKELEGEFKLTPEDAIFMPWAELILKIISRAGKNGISLIELCNEVLKLKENYIKKFYANYELSPYSQFLNFKMTNLEAIYDYATSSENLYSKEIIKIKEQ